jgi:hypothetical protein
VLRLLVPFALVVCSAAWADAPVDRPSDRSPDPAHAADFAQTSDTISLEVPHAFSRASVHERLGYLLEYWNHRFGVKAEWRGDQVFLSGWVFGMAIRARFEITDKAVTGVAADPGWLWRHKARAYVTAKLRKYLDPDYAER